MLFVSQRIPFFHTQKTQKMKLNTTSFYCPICQAFRTGSIVSQTMNVTVVRCNVCKENATRHLSSDNEIENDQS